jgi:hypothetical protein
MPRKAGKEQGWDEIGKMIGKKMEKGMKEGECCGRPWHHYMFKHHDHDGGFFGRALFVTGIMAAMNALGYLHGIAAWILVVIWVGFALMKF